MSTHDDGRHGAGLPTPPPPYAAGPYAAAHHPPPQYATPGAPVYAPLPGHGAPMGYRRPTNTLAILSLVLAFVFAPAGIALGVVARRQIRQTGEEGAGLALAGIVVGGVACALVALLIVLWFVLVAALAGVSFGP